MGLKDRFKVRSEQTVPSDSAAASGIENPDAELRSFKKQHQWDPFLEVSKLEDIDAALDSGNIEKEAAIDQSLIQENSPYAEVRAAVPPTDSDVPASTLRAWIIGFITSTVVTACNILLSFRSSPISITSTVVQLVAYPMGCFCARVIPDKTIRLFGHNIRLNPGPFSIKEHTIITIMTAAGSAPSYAFDILLAQEIFYHQFFKWGFQLMLVMSTQAMGFGLAGVARRFLVWPAAMVWPATLIFSAVMQSLHNHGGSDPALTNGWSIGKYSFFLIVAIGAFCYEWLPQVIFPALGMFTFATWAAPKNVIVNQLFGGQSGLGMLPISFDWGVYSGFLLSPLQTPAFAHFNVGAGLMVLLIGSIGLAYAGPEYYRYLPMSANINFDRYAKTYNVSRILTKEFTVNETAYKEYSPILLGPTFSLSYGMGFAALISTLTHVALFYGPDIVSRARDSKYETPDIHLRLMRKYKEAPEWWFVLVFLGSFGMGMAASQAYDTHLPWWAFIVCIIIGTFFFLPIGIIQAVTNQQPGLNVVSEMIIGYMLPGRPIAMMLFKSWAYMLCANGLNYVSDMKIGHYIKIPPRTMFAAQSFAVIWLSIVQVCTYNFLRGNIREICTENQAQGLTCPNARTFYNASVIWGVIGPRRVFGAGGIYSWTNYFWLIGFGSVVIHYFLARRYPRSKLRYLVIPAIFYAPGNIPPATLYNLFQWVIVGIIFNFFIRRAFFGWWSGYNYVLSGALDIGTAFCSVFVGIGLGLGAKSFPSWWGTTVFLDTLDHNRTALTKVFQKGQTPIGPPTW